MIRRYHTVFGRFRQVPGKEKRRLIPPPRGLLLAEGLAVGALIHGGSSFVCADHDLVQRAIVLSVTVMGTGPNRAFDALVCVAVHSGFLLFLDSPLVCPLFRIVLQKLSRFRKSCANFLCHALTILSLACIIYAENPGFLK